MKARLTVGIIGEVSYLPGDVVEGALAEELVSVGYAVEIAEKATASVTLEKRPDAAVRKTK